MNTSAYRDIGRIANAGETRSSSLVKGSDGQYYLVVCGFGFVTSLNLHTKVSTYCPFPENELNYPFGSIAAKNGKVYLGGGRLFMEFDPVCNAFTFYSDIHADKVYHNAWCCTEDENGIIYFGSRGKNIDGVCHSYLVSYNPETHEMRDYGIVNPAQEYLGTLAVDNAGYIYCGFGTETKCIVAVERESGKIIPLPILESTGGDAAEICRATNGEVYGAFSGSLCASAYRPSKKWYRLYGGELLEEMTEPFVSYQESIGHYGTHCPYEEHPEILAVELIEHYVKYRHPDTGEITEAYLEYETVGAPCSPMTEGPDGKLYGTTNHPFQFYTYDPETDELKNYGIKQFPRGATGNICAYAKQGDILGGAAYCGGHIIRIDTTQPMYTGYDVNPHCEASFRELLRPRSACSMPDGKTMIFGGYNDNGVTGTGVIVYDSEARTCKSIPNEKMLFQHSVLSMVPLSETLVLCGSCIEAPCGGYIKEPEAKIFLYDLEKESIVYSLVPVPGARTISHMKMDGAGLIHGITSNSVYFAFDPVKCEVLATKDLSAYGGVPRDGMKTANDGIVYGLLTKGIYRILPGTTEAEIISVPPCDICAGMAVIGNKIYFGASLTHLWSYTIEK